MQGAHHLRRRAGARVDLRAGGAAAAVAALAGFVPSAQGAALAAAPADACPGAQAPIAAATVAASTAALTCLLGAARRDRGLAVPAADDGLAGVAGAHATDMVRRGYLAHTTPDGASVSDRLRAAGWIPAGDTWWAGEVLGTGSGAASTPSRLVATWLRSAAQRKVILSSRPDRLGVGVARNTPDGRHPASGVTVVAVLGRLCPAASSDPLSGYTTDPSDLEDSPCAA